VAGSHCGFARSAKIRAMSRSSWNVAVATLFAIATWVTPVPENLRLVLVRAAWVLLVGACLGWVVTHNRQLRRYVIDRNDWRFLARMLLAAGGIALSAIVWVAAPIMVAPSKPGPPKPRFEPTQGSKPVAADAPRQPPLPEPKPESTKAKFKPAPTREGHEQAPRRTEIAVSRNPAAEGARLLVDGTDAQIQETTDNFITILVPAGDHTLSVDPKICETTHFTAPSTDIIRISCQSSRWESK